MLELIIFGFLISLVVSMVGLGGGVLFLPLLVIIYNIEPASAVGISLFAMMGVTLSSSVGYFCQNKVDMKLSILYDLFDIPGVIIGAAITVLILPNTLLLICGAIILIMGFLLFFSNRLKLIHKNKKMSIKTYIIASISSLFGGLVTGLSGMGGGTIDTATMVLLGVPFTKAVASSEFAMLLTNIFGFLIHNHLGNIDYSLALPLFIGSLIGGLIGSRYAKRINQEALKKILSIFIIILGIRLIFL